ncbi:threonine ammonia-lyase IlvA [Roseobacter sp. N2S]|uniref:threonine ammonia-lyase IlvA n=1 Tax=Roseobacter sp. N2S TaxID=2663844 RepID=UPI002865509D|nr:threonine ammonia-lyase IlvA [Roseobacter sp. N2S]MDR6264493.1 threonine dehydratase [Roseobacter sp. N2S]
MTDFRAAAQQACDEMRALFEETPLQRNDHLSLKYDADIWLKREDLSPVRSYKIRGAFNALRKARAAQPDQTTFVCASAGNHAQGMAYVCRHFDVRGVIFMPVTTPAQKIEKTRIFGGSNIEIVLKGDYFDDTLAEAQAYCTAKGAHFLSPFDDDDVIEGQASVAVEIARNMQVLPDMVVLPVGGGGLSAGIKSYFGGQGPELIFAEPAGGASLKAALRAGTQVTLQKVDNFVDGAAVARIGDRNFAVLQDVSADQVYPVDEDRLCTTMIEMLNIEGIVLEPAGALSIDVLADIADQIKGKTVVCVSSGGNFDFERLPEVKERAQRFLGLKKYFILRLPQRPGALKDFLGLLGPKDDIARFEYLKKSARNFGTVLIGIETDDPANFGNLDARITQAGFDLRDITKDAAIADFLI